MHPLKNFKGKPTQLGIGSGFSVPAINLKVLPTGLVMDGIRVGRQNSTLTRTPHAPRAHKTLSRSTRSGSQKRSQSTMFWGMG